MKPLLIAPLLLLAACSAYHERTPGGSSVTLILVGTNAHQITAGQLAIDRLNQSDGLKAGGEVLKSLTRIKAGTGLINTGLKQAGQITQEAVR